MTNERNSEEHREAAAVDCAVPLANKVIGIRDPGGVTEAVLREGQVILPKEFTRIERRRHLAAPKRTDAPTKARVSIVAIKDVGAYGAQALARRVVAALGNNVTANLLGVAKDRPSRWASGQDEPSAENLGRLADVDSLLSHVLSAFTPAQAVLWLEGTDPHLQARPVDVFRIDGSAPLLEALRAHRQGAFA